MFLERNLFLPAIIPNSSISQSNCMYSKPFYCIIISKSPKDIRKHSLIPTMYGWIRDCLYNCRPLMIKKNKKIIGQISLLITIVFCSVKALRNIAVHWCAVLFLYTPSLLFSSRSYMHGQPYFDVCLYTFKCQKYWNACLYTHVNFNVITFLFCKV